MAFTNFAVPLLEGKTNAWKAACAEINGAKKELYLASRCNLDNQGDRCATTDSPWRLRGGPSRCSRRQRNIGQDAGGC